MLSLEDYDTFSKNEDFFGKNVFSHPVACFPLMQRCTPIAAMSLFPCQMCRRHSAFGSSRLDFHSLGHDTTSSMGSNRPHFPNVRMKELLFCGLVSCGDESWLLQFKSRALSILFILIIVTWYHLLFQSYRSLNFILIVTCIGEGYYNNVRPLRKAPFHVLSIWQLIFSRLTIRVKTMPYSSN